MEKTGSEGIVYVLVNPAMDGLVKIGKTARDSVEARLNELYGTGVPVPFECVYAAKVVDEGKVEKAFHQAFGPYRINPRREFFKIEPEQAIALLSLLAMEDVTPSIQAEADAVDRDAHEASEKLRQRRPNMNFLEMGIPIGSELTFSQNPEEKVIVVTERKVTFRGNETSLTAVTRELYELSYSIAPANHWYFHGKLLNDIYDDTYER